MNTQHSPMTPSKPIGLELRASSWTITFVIGLSIAVDLLVYSIIIPVIPFQLEKLGYSNISALTGWLLFCYSSGLGLLTIPVAMFSERYNARQWPLIIGIVTLAGSQVMFMEAPNYPVMCIARVIQGVGSSMVWVVGLALLCDSTPPTLIGTQVGLAITGLSIGVAVGPPLGGTLYTHFGFRGPFIFGLAATFLDLIGRVIIIERKHAIQWGYDPAAVPENRGNCDSEAKRSTSALDTTTKSETEKREEAAIFPPSNRPVDGEKKLSLLAVISKLSKSHRALTALFIIFTYGLIFGAQEPAVPLHLQRVWGLDSKRVGLTWIAIAVPTFFSSALAGIWADKSGTEWPTMICLLLSLPWWFVVILEYRLALFISASAFGAFFMSGVLSPMTVELTAVSKELGGVGFAHVYGAFNIMYGIGSTVGPIIGGQMYAHIEKGWMAICLLFVGLLVVTFLLSFRFIGENPLYVRLTHRNHDLE